MVTEASVTSWAVAWLRSVHGIDACADDALFGVLDSLALAELLVACEAHFKLRLDEGFDLDVLASVGTFAEHVASRPRAPSERIWFRSHTEAATADGPIASEVAGRIGSAAAVARIASGEIALGVSLRGQAYATDHEPLGADRWLSTVSGSLLALGAQARDIQQLVSRLDGAMAALDAIPVWYPMATSSPVGIDHQQAVKSGLTSGRLGHAACLQLLAELPEIDDAIYAGLGYAYRHEPGRRFDARGRLEAYRVYEVVVTGARPFLARAWDALHEMVIRELAPFGDGTWATGRDGFTPGMTRKLEWLLSTGGGTIALASLNEHGDTFVKRPGRGSFCLGIGVDRLASLGALA